MHVLVIKKTSLGDVVHVLPALEDAFQMIPDIRFDWVVDPMYMDLPKLHVAVDQVIAGRNKREPKGRTKWDKIKRNFKMIKNVWDAYRIDDFKNEYDYVVDMQCSEKNIPMLLGPLRRYEKIGFAHGHGTKHGYVAKLYDRKIKVGRNLTAVDHYRHLMAQALGYEIPKRDDMLSLMYRSTKNPLKEITDKPVVLFFHSTSWENKAPSISFWRDMLEKSVLAGYHVGIAALGGKEIARANTIAEADPDNATVLADLPLKTWFTIINQSIGAIGGDTGLTHLNSAFSKPTLGIHTATSMHIVPPMGMGNTSDAIATREYCAPCYKRDGCHRTGGDWNICTDHLDRDEAWSRFKILIKVSI